MGRQRSPAEYHCCRHSNSRTLLPRAPPGPAHHCPRPCLWSRGFCLGTTAWAVLFISYPVLPKPDSQYASQPSNPGRLLPSLDGLFSPPRTSLTIFCLLVSVRPFSPARAAVPGSWSSVQQPPCVCAARGPLWLPQPCPLSRLCQPHPHFFSQVLSSLPSSSSQCLQEAPTLASGHCLSANEDRDRPEMGSPCQLCCS